MSAPPDDQRRVPPYVALVRIGAVIAMSASAAFGIFLLLAGVEYFVWGFACLAISVPFFWIMRLVERTAEDDEVPADHQDS